MEKFARKFATAVVQWRFACMSLSVCLVALLLAVTPEWKVETEFEIYFEADDPDLVAYQTITEEFSQENNVVLLVRQADGGEVSGDAYAVAQAIAEFANRDPDVDRVGSPTEFEILRTQGDDITTQRVVPEQPPFDAAAITKSLLDDRDAVGRVIARDATVLAISARFFEKPAGADELVTATNRYRALASELEQRYPSVDVLVSGLIPLEATLFEIMISDSLTLIPVLFGVVIILMILLMGTAVGVIATLIVAGLSALCCLITIPLLGFRFNDVNVASILVVVTIASADCIHVLVRFYAEKRLSIDSMDNRKLVISAFEHVLPPIGLTTVTTMIGFALFWFAESPPIKQFGVVSAAGVGFAFLFATAVFVPLLACFPPKRKEAPKVHAIVGNVLIRVKSLLQQRWAWRSAVTFCVVLGAFSFLNEVDDDIVEYVSERTEVRTAVNLSQGRLNGLQFIDVVFATSDGATILHPDHVRVIDAVSLWLNEHPSVTGVDSLTSQLKRVQAAIDDKETFQVSLPPTENGLSELLFLLEIVSKPGALEDTINFVRTQTKVRAYVGDETASELLALDEAIKAQLQTLDMSSNIRVTTTGPTLMFAFLGKKNIISVFYGTLTFILVVTVTLGLAFKSWRMGLLSIVPNLFPILLVFGIWYFANGTLNLAGVATITAILGLVVDDTIHIMWNYLRSSKSDRISGRGIFVDLAPALTTTSACFTLGFAVLLLSAFTPTQTMGALVALAISAAYLFDLVMLPRLLAATDRLQEKRP